MADTILIVEDEPDMLMGLEDSLVHEGYTVVTAPNGREGLKKALELKPDVIILDVKMPLMNGYEVCSALRKRGVKTPVIMLTAGNTEDEKVRGLDTGADDYVTKPFSSKELIARIRAVRRRPGDKKEKIKSFSFSGIKVNFDHQTITKKGETVELSSCESELLRLLVMHAGEAVSREVILTEVWGYNFPPDTRTIDNHIVRLRQKIEDDPREPRHILTAYGTGYKFVH